MYNQRLGEGMNKYPLIGVSIIAVILLILGSFTNVVGYQTVQSSNQKVINDLVDPKELLFQTIVDVANNKEIQKIILNSESSRGRFFNPSIRFSTVTPQVLTKNNLKHMFIIGLMLSKIISKSKIHSMVEQYQVNSQGLQKEITPIIEKDSTINRELTQLSNSECGCENDNTTQWSFPILCILLFPLLIIAIIYWITTLNQILVTYISIIWIKLNCFWIY